MGRRAVRLDGARRTARRPIAAGQRFYDVALSIVVRRRAAKTGRRVVSADAIVAGAGGSAADGTEGNTQTRVGDASALVQRDRSDAVVRGRRADERVVHGTADHSGGRETRQKGPMLGGRQHERLFGEAQAKQIRRDVGRDTVRDGQARQDRVRLQRAVTDEHGIAFKGGAREVVLFVPARERRHDDARIRSDAPPAGGHRRTASRVARTCSAVSLGSSRSGSATYLRPRRTSFTSVGGGSRTTWPSRSSTSRGVPSTNPSASRITLGTMTRPAASMVVFMVFKYHQRRQGAIRRRRSPEAGTCTRPNARLVAAHDDAARRSSWRANGLGRRRATRVRASGARRGIFACGP